MILRTALIVLALLAAFAPTAHPAEPKRLLLLGQSPDGHPKQTHEYMPGVRIIAKLLKNVPGLRVTVAKADEPWAEGPDLLAKADGVVMFLSEGAKWVHQDRKRLAMLTTLAGKEVGFVGLHWGIGSKEAANVEGYQRLVGGCHGGPDRKYVVVETDAQPPDTKCPITAGIGKFRVKDEFYYQIKFVKSDPPVKPVLTVTIDGRAEPVAWSWERTGGGRSFGFSGLHFHSNWQLPEYRRLVAQGILWTLKLPIPEKGLDVEIAADELKAE